ncbi:XdhC family protein [Comamonas flocculans]|uniref:XdhC family protein n=1 Tax=Comamonas flocculans TaxID=2597701 RepID=A0A5B8RYM9_9BURK|nr:XdhC family protein [Comamonas flocculans]QEA12937.1 XdhC family protein [Comamonas flocculans]
MENLDLTVLRALASWRAAGQDAVLATVVHTWGSSPRPVGCIMALRGDGMVVGSVSGGCIEYDLIDRYTKPGVGDALARTGPPQFVKYGITADEAHRFGLPCGGTLQILVEFNPEPAAIQQLLAQLDAGRLMHRRVRLADGAVTLEPAEHPADLIVGTQEVVNTFGPGYRMLIIGAGQMSEYLATMALFCGFSVTVCDPREEFAGSWSVAGARLVTTMPDDTVAEMQPDGRTCVIALTHDPKLDDLALLQALDTPAFYIGAIGSRRNSALRHQRMIEHLDQTEESLKNLRGPVGIYIGSKTPPEIAVSVMAEILAVKNGVPLPRDMDVAHVKDLQEITPNDAANVCFVIHDDA